ncbi:hypothetical protein HMN09_01055600 [Mycena chlorophos]|uniref:Uncharacterized protein n=1 Tax=Mycena chlorophos TaxID=658473 RepID=A0A8H6VWE7_MYCCL|nr:hypothetical protein HMN09_01055600 [Mycena chlorophos]
MYASKSEAGENGDGKDLSPHMAPSATLDLDTTPHDVPLPIPATYDLHNAPAATIRLCRATAAFSTLFALTCSSLPVPSLVVVR